MSIPSQSQSSPTIHFTNTIRRDLNLSNVVKLSPSTSINNDSQPEYDSFLTRPQSTPVSSPTSLLRFSSNLFNNHQTNENELTIIKNNKKRRVTTFDYSSLTNVSPLNNLNNQIVSPIIHEISDDDEQEEEQQNRYLLRPPPLLVLSQSVQAKYPEQLAETNLTNQYSSIKDLPNHPANYSLVFYDFTKKKIDEAKRFTRHMGDCFISEIIDITTTHIILSNDDPRITITLDLILALIYGCHIVTFEWLKSSSNIGEWLHVKKFEPKNFFNSNPSLDIYRKSRQKQKSIKIFNSCGCIYLTSIAQQRQLLVKLITLLGGDITVNRDRASIIVGQSSKKLQIVNYPQVNEEWVIDSIKSGQCVSTDNYLIKTNND